MMSRNELQALVERVTGRRVLHIRDTSPSSLMVFVEGGVTPAEQNEVSLCVPITVVVILVEAPASMTGGA